MATAVNTAIGMMDPAYFVGKKEILNWLNNLLKLNLAKIEETSNGAVACQVLDSLFPSMVPMQKVNWGAKNDYDIINNYKVLQSICQKLKIQRSIEVEKLMRARYQDNLEFMQWLKKFFELNYSGVVDEYDSVERRNKGKGVSLFKPAASGGATAGGARPRPGSRAAAGAAGTASTRAKATGQAKTAAGAGTAVRGGAPRAASAAAAAEKENKRSAPRVSGGSSTSGGAAGKGGPRRSVNSAASSSSSNGMSTVTNAQAALDAEEMQRMKKQLKEATDKVSESNNEKAGLREEVANVTQERDFYFGKLREVEVMLESYSGSDPVLKESLLQILYALEDGEEAFTQTPLMLASPSPMAPTSSLQAPSSVKQQVQEQEDTETLEAVVSGVEALGVNESKQEQEGKSSDVQAADERMAEEEEMSPLAAGVMLAAEEKVETARDESKDAVEST